MSNAAFHYGRAPVGECHERLPISLPPLENKDFTMDSMHQEKRCAESVADCAVPFREFSSPDEISAFNLSIPPRKSYDHVQDKELRKKLKNRESAQAARDRKKAKMMFLEKQVSDLIKRNRFLETENLELRKILQLAESQAHWRARSQIEQAPTGYHFASSNQQEQDAVQCGAVPQGRYFQQTLQSVCTYNVSEITVSIPNGTSDNDVEKITNEVGCRAIEANPDSSHFQQTKDSFAGDNGLFRKEGAYSSVNTFDSEPNFIENTIPQMCNQEYPARCQQRGQQGVRNMNAEDWMLNLPGETPSPTSDERTSAVGAPKKRRRSSEACEPFLSADMLQCQELQYPWEGISLSGEEQFAQSCIPEGVNNIAEKTGNNSYGENSYCDSSGVESMSSPDMSTGSAVSSPDIVDRLGQDFFTDKAIFKVR